MKTLDRIEKRKSIDWENVAVCTLCYLIVLTASFISFKSVDKPGVVEESWLEAIRRTCEIKLIHKGFHWRSFADVSCSCVSFCAIIAYIFE